MTTPVTNRRRLLAALLLLGSAGFGASGPRRAMAGEDGGGEGGEGGSDGGGGGDSGGGGGGSDDGGGSGSGGGSGNGGTSTSSGSASAPSHDAQPRDGTLARILRGKIASLPEIQAIAKRTAPGEIVSTRLSQQGGQYVYRVRVIRPNGDIVDVRIDAVSRAILGTRSP